MTETQIGDLTRAQLVASIREAEAICVHWANDPEAPTTMFAGQPARQISLAVEEAWQALRDLTTTDRVEDDAKLLVLCVDDFFAALEEFQRLATLGDDQVDPGGSTELWTAWSMLVAECKDRPAKRALESIAELRAQGVSHRQIAVMYEWFRDDGSPDTGKVFEEIAEPGRHYDPATYVSQTDRRKAAELAHLWDARSSRRRLDGDTPGPNANSGAAPVPESTEDLIRQGVSSLQIARMKGIDQEEVRRLARELGLAIDGTAPGPALSAEQHLAQVRSREADRLRAANERAAENAAADATAGEETGPVNTYAELDNPTEQIRQMTWDGHSAETIWKALKDQHAVSRQTVRAAVRQAKEDAEAGPAAETEPAAEQLTEES